MSTIKNTKNILQSNPLTSDEQYSKERDAFLFQIGFDFGTSSSKVVIRDVNIDKAWVFRHSDVDNISSILIPSVVLFHGDTFMIHDSISTLYPPNGLYHLKVALEKVALGKLDNPILLEYKKIIGENYKYSQSEITKMATIFFLSLWLKKIVAHIKERYPDYGNVKEDLICVNMAIPVENICNENVRELFRSILSIAWELKSEQIIDNRINIDKLYKDISRIQSCHSAKNEFCQVYPEVSANIQAFINSPASSPDQTTIYFFTDVGAGTIDQSVFTYAGQEGERKVNYFAGKVFLHGSRTIEINACRGNTTAQNLEHWRRIKEKDPNNKKIIAAKNIVRSAVYRDSQKTLRETKKCLPEGNGISKQKTLREKVKFIFSGGGFTSSPYEHGVIDAYKYVALANHDPIVASMPYPKNLELPEKFKRYITRLYVAYGLSFLFDDLVQYSSPSENRILQTNSAKNRKCSCRGMNKNCIKCSGTGIIS